MPLQDGQLDEYGQAIADGIKWAARPGHKTTEFLATILANVAAVAASAAGVLPDRYAAIVGAISVGAYALSRGFAKGSFTSK